MGKVIYGYKGGVVGRYYNANTGLEIIIREVYKEQYKNPKTGKIYNITYFSDGTYETTVYSPYRIKRFARLPFDPNYPRYLNREKVEADNR